jgi:hypothetical protein
LVLSHVQNPIYQQFYRQRSEAGELIILDNGIYERSLNTKELLDSIGLYHPKVVVLPDIFGGPWKDSYELSAEFHNVWKSRLPMEWMFVPQGNDIQAHYDAVRRAVEELQVEWIGIPRRFATDVTCSISARADLCNWIHYMWPHVNVHALGMMAGDIDELDELEKARCQSIDSSAPVWRGWNGYTIYNDAWKTKGTPVNFDAYPETKYDSMIAFNLKQVGVK